MKNYSPILHRTGGQRALIPFRQTPVAIAVLRVLRTDQAELQAIDHQPFRKSPVFATTSPSLPSPSYSAHWVRLGVRMLMPPVAHLIASRHGEADAYCAHVHLLSQFQSKVHAGQWSPRVNPYAVWSGAVRCLFPDVSKDMDYLSRLGEWETQELIIKGGEDAARDIADRICTAYAGVNILAGRDEPQSSSAPDPA